MEICAKSDVMKNVFSTMKTGDATEVVNMTNAKETVQSYAPMCPVIDLVRRLFNVDLVNKQTNKQVRIENRCDLLCCLVFRGDQESE